MIIFFKVRTCFMTWSTPKKMFIFFKYLFLFVALLHWFSEPQDLPSPFDLHSALRIDVVSSFFFFKRYCISVSWKWNYFAWYSIYFLLPNLQQEIHSTFYGNSSEMKNIVSMVEISLFGLFHSCWEKFVCVFSGYL